MHQVTYFNPDLEKTCVLIDNVDAETAAAVVAKFGDPRQPYHYMGPEVKAEEMPAT